MTNIQVTQSVADLIEQMNDGGGEAADGIQRQSQGDIADLCDAGVGEQSLQIVLVDGSERGRNHGRDRQYQQNLQIPEYQAVAEYRIVEAD